MQRKIVITGGPGTGKTVIINELIKQGYHCMEEISRQVTENARKNGFNQLFLSKPLLFSELLLKGRIQQYEEIENSTEELTFFDRGIPDITAYMDFKHESYPKEFIDANEKYKYTKVFILPPWKEIYTSDDVRYETYEESLDIYRHLKASYEHLGYAVIEVPTGTIDKRVNFILNTI